ncbi:N(2)-citryl-N(6)-acetyl-N(6)-hydroxylysine synthase [Enhygromyxa salina]|uniref:N(2)-citryl-N(6)-acetyl-N(6)-hydroxylysine synthase n=2 Tax=Enhygromyxa salina TaxID=215803 RepID=A0A2S9XIC9_9BACT|nr:N(2)-citryl-N(6)-acetyl-N(6)-hydroxylysine synthase [Enhygromyxa salina]
MDDARTHSGPPRRLGDHPAPGFDGSVQALLSALIREFEGWSVRESAGRHELELPLPSQAGVVVVALREPIGVGRIAAGPARWRDLEGELHPLPITELIARLVAEPELAQAIGLDGRDPAAGDRLVARVRASASNLERVLDARAADIEHLLREPLGFVEAEQGLLLGHSVHPAPRLRERLDASHDGRFVPELGGRTQLELWAVARERVFMGGGPEAATRLDELIASDPSWSARAGELGEDFVLLPLHPVQGRALARDPELAQLREREQLRALGPSGRPWAPTSSLRTLHADAAPWMLKASLPIRLTNSLRTLAPAELERGVLLGRVLDETEASALERRHPSFRILREPAYFGLDDGAGGPGPSVSFIALRENPFAAEVPVETLATLVQDHPRSGRSRLALRLEHAASRCASTTAVELGQRWFASFLARVLVPIIEAQAEFGLLLSAHQQNLVLGFAANGELAGLEPRTAWFRDAQGTAYTTLALRRFGERLPGLAAASFAAPLAERVWAYSVVINGVFNVIASLAMIPGLTQSALVEQLRATLETQRERGLADPSALDYLLDAPQLWTKANLRCFAAGISEVSLPDPQLIYRALQNPLARAASPGPELAGAHRIANYADPDARITWQTPTRSSWRRARLDLDGQAHDFELRDAGPRAELRWIGPPTTRSRALILDHLFATRAGLAHVVDGDRVVLRETFYQRPGPWHHRNDRPPPPELGRTTTAGIEHPRRPPAPAGLLYRRYCASIDRSFSLRHFDPERDLDRFCRWMNDPVVARFWDQAWPPEQLRDYIDARLADPHVIPAIGAFDSQDFAYYEIYWAKEDRLGPHYVAEDYDRGFHMAVGEPELRHRGWGRQWFLAMAHFLFLDEPRTQRLVGEPRVDQAMVRGWSKSTAWDEWGEVQFPHKRAALMVMTRERFFASLGGQLG